MYVMQVKYNIKVIYVVEVMNNIWIVQNVHKQLTKVEQILKVMMDRKIVAGPQPFTPTLCHKWGDT